MVKCAHVQVYCGSIGSLFGDAINRDLCFYIGIEL